MADTLPNDLVEPVVTPTEKEQEAAEIAAATMSDDRRRAAWQARRPEVAHLKEGVAFPPGMPAVPLFDVGDRIVVDRCTDLLKGTPWLDTTVGKVRSIDDDTGLVTLLDETSDPRLPSVRYFNFRLHGALQTFKLAPPRGNPFDAPKVTVRAPVAPTTDGTKRGRGRPKGSKNRPKDVIKAEREARRALKARKG